MSRLYRRKNAAAWGDVMAENTGKNEFADALEGKRPRERRTPASAKGGGKGWRLVTIRLDEEVAHRLKVRAAEEDTSVTALICEGINHIFEVRGLPPIAGTKT